MVLIASASAIQKCGVESQNETEERRVLPYFSYTVTLRVSRYCRGRLNVRKLTGNFILESANSPCRRPPGSKYNGEGASRCQPQDFTIWTVPTRMAKQSKNQRKDSRDTSAMMKMLFHSLNRINGPSQINRLLHDGFDDPNRNNCQTTSPS